MSAICPCLNVISLKFPFTKISVCKITGICCMKHYKSVMMAHQLNDHKIVAMSSHVINVDNAA